MTSKPIFLQWLCRHWRNLGDNRSFFSATLCWREQSQNVKSNCVGLLYLNVVCYSRFGEALITVSTEKCKNLHNDVHFKRSER